MYKRQVYGLFEEEHPDVVVNFAAESHVHRSIADPSLFLQTNIIGTSVLMDAAVFVQTVQNRQDVIISAPEEVAYHMGWLTKAQLLAAAARYDHCLLYTSPSTASTTLRPRRPSAASPIVMRWRPTALISPTCASTSPCRT